MIEDNGLRPIRWHGWENFPAGTVPHTTMPLDALIAGPLLKAIEVGDRVLAWTRGAELLRATQQRCAAAPSSARNVTTFLLLLVGGAFAGHVAPGLVESAVAAALRFDWSGATLLLWVVPIAVAGWFLPDIVAGLIHGVHRLLALTIGLVLMGSLLWLGWTYVMPWLLDRL